MLSGSRLHKFQFQFFVCPLLHLLGQHGDELSLEGDVQHGGVIPGHVDDDDIVLKRRQAHLENNPL